MRRAAPWLAAGLGLGLTLLAFWPGYLSWDSAYQWWQARSGQIDPTHPPVMVRLWQLSRMAMPDPGGMLLLQATLWWGALALFADALGGSATRRAGTVLLTGLWPPLLGLLPHLWKDVWLMALFALAVACLVQDLRTPRRAWRVAALSALALACAFRFNALPGALPLLAWIAWRQWPRRKVGAAVATLAMAAVMQVFSTAVNHVPGGRDVPVWPSVAMWDLAAVSIAEDRLLFPPDWVDPGLTVDDLRRDFVEYVNVPSFASGQLRLNYYYDYTPAQFAALRAAWLSLPREHGAAYAAHRARVSQYLLGLRQAEQPDYLVLQPGVIAYKDNPALARPEGRVHGAVQSVLDRLVDAPVFAPWLYLLAALALLAWHAIRRPPGGPRALATMVAGSSLALALPLLLLSPSSDFRYLGWCVLAAWLAGWLYWPPENRSPTPGSVWR
ncbi:hypothetical protein [Arenimonas sp. MALMAid1274]|uniref:hypothetical protein n=1 Tax=Arenimonas sp. MALMAid1274 TaxID=3411630 RepID=UPI003BA1F076